MDDATRNTIADCSQASQAGTIHFGEVIATLIRVGVESYFADYRSGCTSYYRANGEVLALELDEPDVPIPQAFDAAALRAAIGGAQRGEVMYPEFLRRSRAAGCVGYIVWIAGRHVSYFGRRGEAHIERFPD